MKRTRDEPTDDEPTSKAIKNDGEYWSEKQHAAINTVKAGKNVFISGGGGVGKCVHFDTPVIMFDGTVKPARDVIIGDILMGDDSTPRNVLSTCAGRSNMYKVVQRNGHDYIVNEPHVLTLKSSYLPGISWSGNDVYPRYRVTEHGIKPKSKSFHVSKFSSQGAAKKAAEEYLETLPREKYVIDIPLNEYLCKTKTWKEKHNGFKVGVEFSEKQVDFDPYVVGAWLGDGTTSNTGFTNADKEVIDEVRSRVSKYGLELRKTPSREITYNITPPHPCKKGQNAFLNFLRTSGMLNNKHIPFEFSRNSRQMRLTLLAGLIDTDGYYQNNVYEIVQKSERLSKDIEFLCRSLGFAVNRREVKKKCYNSPDPNHLGTYYKTSFWGEKLDEIPVVSPRRKGLPRKQIKDPLVTCIEIEPLGEGDYCGFMLDGNSRFLLGDFTVTHNSHCLTKIIETCVGMNKRVKVTASTGVAALGINCGDSVTPSTLHSVMGMGIAKDSVDKLKSMVSKKKEVADGLRAIDVMIIDEISMIDAEFFDKCDQVLKHVRRSPKPFGGIQLIACGDFLQLPPPTGAFCFKSNAWTEIKFTNIILTEVFRQSDQTFVEFLNRIRFAERRKLTETDIKILQSCVGKNVTTDDGIEPTTMYSRLDDVDRTNTEELNKLKTDSVTITAEVDYEDVDGVMKRLPYAKSKLDYMLVNELKSVQAPSTLTLKVGAQVILLKNISVSTGLANGSRGIITKFDGGGMPVVKFTNGLEISIPKSRWHVSFNMGISKAIKYYDQCPLKLAWALSIHRAQGCSLDLARTSLNGRVFAAGQSYVALSRCRSLEGLTLDAFDPNSIWADETAVEFYKNIKE